MPQMLKIRSIVLTFISVVSLLFFATPVLAGGGNVWLIADGDGSINNVGTYGRVVRIFISPDLPCKGAQITFKFVEPKEGDWIHTGSENETYLMQEDRQPLYRNGVMGTTCSTYAKVGSNVFGDRIFYATVKTTDGKTTDSQQLTLHMDGKDYGTGIGEDPYWGMTIPTDIPMPGAPEMVYPQNGQTLDLEGAYMFKVKPVAGASGYLFGLFQDGVMTYENYRDTKTLSSNGEFALWESNPAHAKFHAGEVKVMIRALVRNQWTDAREITLILRSRGNSDIVQTTTIQQPSPQQTSVSKPPTIQPSQKIVVVTDSSASAALQRRIDDLQKKLEESQLRQSALESKLNQIISWIKSVFPFFK